MAGGDKKIHEHPKANTKGFDVNPQNRNNDGRPRNSFNSFNQKCKDNGIEEVTKNVYFTTFGNLMNMFEDELNVIEVDKDEPQWIRWLITDLKNPLIRAKIMSDYRDWLFGKADSKMTIDGGLEIKAKKDYSKYSTEDLKAILEISKKYEEKK